MDGKGYPILMYHALARRPAAERYVVSEEDFRAQMQRMAILGARGVGLSEMLAGRARSGVDVVITFDDGDVSNATVALPVLKDFGFSATFFITTARVETGPQWLSWRQLEFLRGQGMDLQAHGHTHRFLDGLPSADLDDELILPRTLFAERLGHAVDHLSFPGGRYDRRTLKRAAEIGYRTLSSSIPGLNSFDGALTPALLKRMVVHQQTSQEDFERIVRRDIGHLRRQELRYKLKRRVRGVLGDRIYYRLWARANRKGEQLDG